MIRAVPVVIIVLLLVWAVLATMALNKAKEERTDDSAHQAYVDSVKSLIEGKDYVIGMLEEGVVAQTRTIDSLRSLRMNPEVFHQEARQDVQRMDMDSVFSILDAPPQ